MKYLLTIIIASISLSKTISQSTLEGVWDTGMENTLIHIYKSDDQYMGKVLASDNEKAPIDMQVLRNVKQVESHWEGEFFIPRFGTWMEAEFAPSKESLDVQVSVGWFKRKRTWSRVIE